jgi:hypothetical protein
MPAVRTCPGTRVSKHIPATCKPHVAFQRDLLYMKGGPSSCGGEASGGGGGHPLFVRPLRCRERSAPLRSGRRCRRARLISVHAPRSRAPADRRPGIRATRRVVEDRRGTQGVSSGCRVPPGNGGEKRLSTRAVNRATMPYVPLSTPAARALQAGGRRFDPVTAHSYRPRLGRVSCLPARCADSQNNGLTVLRLFSEP